jgi:hypothetical protein
LRLALGAGLAIIGALLLGHMLVYLVQTLTGLSLWVAYLIVGAIFAIGGVLLLMQGTKRMKDVDPLPRETIESVKEDIHMEQFGDEFQLLKAAAITSVIGLVRDAVRQNLPALDQELGRLRSEQGESSAAPSASARVNDTVRPTSDNDTSRYYHTADTRLRERAVGEMSTQADVGRSPNYDFTPPASHVEPGGRP